MKNNQVSDINKWKDSYKWQFEAYPFFCSVYQKITGVSKNKYYDPWTDFINYFNHGHLVAFVPKITLNLQGEVIIQELLDGKNGFLVLFKKVHKKIRKAIENCLLVREQEVFMDFRSWWPELQKVLSEISNIIFPFDFTLNDKMKEWQEKNDPIFKILNEALCCDEDSFFNKAEIDALKIKNKFNKSEDVYQEFIRKLGWIQNSYAGMKKLSQKWIDDFISGASHNRGKQCVNRRIAGKYKLLIETSNLGIIFRDDKKKLLLIGVELMEKWLKIICRQKGWKFKELRWLSMDEVLLLLQGEKKYLVMAKKYAQQGKRIGIMDEIGYTGVSENFFRKVAVLQIKNLNLQEIKGLSGNKGYYKGVVKIITDIKKEGKNLKAGEILATSMTRPEYLPLMKKAGAFITDEGGITCHAAIVAREMKKPCIIGTKIATQVLKDGDLVEVDADKGVVKVIKRKK